MLHRLRKIMSQRRYGDPIIVVSGLPRSGTSMLMKMLEAGGVEIIQDGLRKADVDNIGGYYEYELVKKLDKGGDASWLFSARGKVVKVISHLLTHLPAVHYYKVIFVIRNLSEVLASQRRMLMRSEKNYEKNEDERLCRDFEVHLKDVVKIMKRAENMDVLTVQHREIIEDPRREAEKICRFLGKTLNLDRMAEIVNLNLYRNRA